MELHEIPHPDNFDFVREVRGDDARLDLWTAKRRLEGRVCAHGEDVFSLSLSGRAWPKRRCLHSLNTDFGPEGTARLEVSTQGAMALSLSSRARKENPQGRGRAVSFLGASGATIGVCGSAWLLRFALEPEDRFFGAGEKWGPLEKRGQRFVFWNTDVWADFSGEKVWYANVDSPYISIPYLIWERRGVFAGILLDNPSRTFMSLGAKLSMSGEVGGEASHDSTLYFGAMADKPIVYFLMGPTLDELTQKMQRLVGTTPRPPLWALGHHQSRWGYASTKDLDELDRHFSRLRIPNDGLWLDIDYMDEYRVFSTKGGALSRKSLARLAARRRRVVPILDPGVKVEPGGEPYEEGLRDGHFCLSPSGRPYTGIVWPGRTHFPDFSQKRTRAWWARWVSDFKGFGFAGFWIDMNDPATGPIENDSMLFSSGKWSHHTFHNQYGLAMAVATRDGIVRSAPNERPFVLSRSACTGMARYAAVWTGDNVSNFHHLARAIPTSINLALSGIPFNGPDVVGFGGNASPQLAELFYQALFLFPFLRNHSVHDSRRQEPWAFGARTTRILRHYIRLRYRFLPYLYQCFIAQEQSGAPILTPCAGGLEGKAPPSEDQYMVGGSLLFAPRVRPESTRRVWLPEGHWYCLREGKWLRGGRFLRLNLERGQTPVYVRSGTVLPMAREKSLDPRDGGAPHALELLGDIELHVFLRPGESADLEYVLDDGCSLEYQTGVLRRFRFAIERQASTVLSVRELSEPAASLPFGFRAVLHGVPSSMDLVVDGHHRALRLRAPRFSGKRLQAMSSGPLALLHRTT